MERVHPALPLPGLHGDVGQPVALQRYSVSADAKLLAQLSFGASAWKLAARDTFIGWQDHQRRKNLHLVVNNARFLILPWIQCKGLASKILSIVNRQLPNDWQQRYGFRPVLLETFVQTERHRRTSYKAANWLNLGKTTGRGKKSRVHAQIIPIKDIWLYPLLPAAKELPLSALRLNPLRLNPLRQHRAYGSTECLHAYNKAQACRLG